MENKKEMLAKFSERIEQVKGSFKGKTVYCNMGEERVLFDFFRERFEELGLDTLMASERNESGNGVLHTYYGDDDPMDMPLAGDGDFRSKVCLMLLSQSDIVVGVPPHHMYEEWERVVRSYGKACIAIAPNGNCVASETLTF